MAKTATREAYGKALVEFGAKYDFVVMDADLTKSTKTDMFKKEYPERHINTGIAEGNMISVAAGIATTGKPVFASSFAMFAAGRAYEQIRNAVGYPHLNVKVVGSHVGISVGEDGATHQCNEDIALMRTIPGMAVFSPCDAAETRACVEMALRYDGPCYIRTGRNAVENLYGEDETFELGRGKVVRDGADVAIIATGAMVQNALEAADMLAAEGVSAAVLDIFTIKPIDKELIAEYAGKTGCLVTAEEHTICGGLGSAVCEAVCATKPVPVKMVGMPDSYGRSGKVPDLFAYYHMTAGDIAAAARAAIAAK